MSTAASLTSGAVEPIRHTILLTVFPLSPTRWSA